MKKNIFLKLIFAFLLFSFSYSFAQIEAVDDVRKIRPGNTNSFSVLTNDRLNGSTPNTNNVIITQLSTTNPGVTLNTATGTVSVALSVVPGQYSIEYQICITSDPTICDSAIITINVPSVDAIDDCYILLRGETSPTSMRSNDWLNSTTPATPANTTLLVAGGQVI